MRACALLAAFAPPRLNLLRIAPATGPAMRGGSDGHHTTAAVGFRAGRIPALRSVRRTVTGPMAAGFGTVPPFPRGNEVGVVSFHRRGEPHAPRLVVRRTESALLLCALLLCALRVPRRWQFVPIRSSRHALLNFRDILIVEDIITLYRRKTTETAPFSFSGRTTLLLHSAPKLRSSRQCVAASTWTFHHHYQIVGLH